MLFDGECALCREIVERWRAATGGRIQFVPYQEADSLRVQIGERELRRAVHFVDPEGETTRGAEAIFRAAAHCGRKRWLAWLYATLPPFAWAAELVYRAVAANRSRIAAVRRVWNGRDLRPPTYHISSALFLRVLGAVYLIAFVSLWVQIDGLVGDRGILPASEFLSAVSRFFSATTPPQSPVWHVPTLAWISPHDGFLDLLCGGGALLSVLLMCGVLPIATLALLWVFYLSLFHAGQTFLSFQWDILLLEAGFLAIFMAPGAWRSKFLADRHPSRLAIWLVWWLLFRLMFESGAVKLTWNRWDFGPDGARAANTWTALTALNYHYWTQPLPMRTSWYAAQLPEWFQKLSVIVLLVIELGLPWLIFGPRRLRYAACAGITLVMVLIGGTGNYNFFNLLTAALALTLLDDEVWPQWLRSRLSGTDWPGLFSPTRWRSILLVPFAGLAMVVGLQQLKEAVAPGGGAATWPGVRLEHCAVLSRERLRVVPANDRDAAGDRDRGQRRRDELASLRIPLEAGRPGAGAAVQLTAPAAAGLANVV